MLHNSFFSWQRVTVWISLTDSSTHCPCVQVVVAQSLVPFAMGESHTLAWLLTLEEPHTSVIVGSASLVITPESVREMAVGVGHHQFVSSKEVCD